MQTGMVLIVDDEGSIRRELSITLSGFGLNAVMTQRGKEALSLVRSNHFDAVLLDLNLPDMNGIDTCKEMRRLSPHLPILILTARDGEADKVEALDAGADDYVTKPFNLRELVARIRGRIRCSRLIARDPLPEQMEPMLQVGEIQLDLVRRTMKKANRPVHLTPKEFELTRQLMSSAGRPVAHSLLLTSVWGAQHGQELEYLRTFVHQLRKKLEDDPSNPKYLLTDSKFGYRFSDDR